MVEDEKGIFVKNLKEGDITAKFQIYEKRIRKTRTDKDYIELVMGDKTGITTARLFFEPTDVQIVFKSLSKGDLVKLEGQYSETFKSISVNDPARISKCNPNEYRMEDFICVCDKNLEELFGKIKTTIEAMENTHLKSLLKEFFDDQPFINMFKETPSAMSVHHNYVGGNLEHTVGVLRLCKTISAFYKIDEDLLFSGAILHDIGKIQTYTFEKSLPTRTNEEKMIGHVIIGDRMIHDIINEKFQDFPGELKNQLSHLILSHHGKTKWGSPISPETSEAIVLHYADLLDSQVKKSLQRKL